MKTIKRQNKIDLLTFNCALFLLFLSFFEESTLWKFSYIGLVAVFLFPIVLFVGMRFNCITLDSHDKQIVLCFCIFALIQGLGISFSSIYKSLTPIYRTISVVLTIVYIRHVIWTDEKFRALDFLSFFVILFGFISFLLPQQKDTNPFFGNLNTVGALYFSFFALNYIQFLKTHKYIKLLYSGLSISLVIISNTRTAMFLILLAIVLCVAIKWFIGKNTKPLVFFVLSISVLVLFIVFYYNIKNNQLYSLLNSVSKVIFHKNFDSGRPDLWKSAVDVVGDMWIMGRGTFVELSDFVVGKKTSHSVYFDIYLKNGILGLGFYIIAIINVLKSKKTWKYNKLNVFIMIIASILLLYNAMAVTLIKPRSGIGLIHWILIALPYNNIQTAEENNKYRYADKVQTVENVKADVGTSTSVRW